MAGGDGSLINLLMKAKENGVNLGTLTCCVLPYGTGNDFARVSGWGGRPRGEIYSNIKRLVTEICLNSHEKKFNVWSVIVKFRSGGTTYEVNSKTK